MQRTPMIESRRIVEVLRLRKLAEATIAGRVSLIRGGQRIAFMASSLAIAVEEAKHIDRILDVTTHLVVDANPLLWAPEFIERNARLVEAFVDAHARDLLAAYASIAAHCRSALRTCFACGYPALMEPMYERTNRPSHQTCPSCGFVFGEHDKNAGWAYERWRERWLAAGAAWHVGDAPAHWNGRAQLAAFLSHDSQFDK